MNLGKDGYPIVSEEMWCSSCEHFWETKDYYHCEKCEKCGAAEIYRTDSTSFAYVYLDKHPLVRPEQTKRLSPEQSKEE